MIYICNFTEAVKWNNSLVNADVKFIWYGGGLLHQGNIFHHAFFLNTLSLSELDNSVSVYHNNFIAAIHFHNYVGCVCYDQNYESKLPLQDQLHN